MSKARPLTDIEVSHLEALVKSPALGALKALLDIYRDQCVVTLTASKDPVELYQTQGRLIGINMIDNLPSLYLEEKARREKARAKSKS